jgi:putative glutamine amidotransferase
LVEAVRWQGSSYVLGVQWHPEFHDPGDLRLLDGTPLLREFLAEAARVKKGTSETAKA